MLQFIARGAAFCALSLFLCACSGFNSFYNRDPLTGGVNVVHSATLGVPIPPGMQFYPSHSSRDTGSGDSSLETYRGALSPATAALNTHNNLKRDGWQLRLASRTGDRWLDVYAKGDRLAIVALRRQGMLTIMELWTGQGLPDGAELILDAPASAIDRADENCPADEEAGAIEENDSPEVETWGLEER